jgi:hypothetical protein
MMTASNDASDLLDSMLFIRPELEEATTSPWRPFAVERAPKPLPVGARFVAALGPGVAIEADEDTGRVRIFTDEYDLEVLGKPGEELTVTDVERHTDLDYWLREVHARYWEFGPALEKTLHDKTDTLAAGTEPRPGVGQARLFAPDFRVPAPEWAVPGAKLHYRELDGLGSADSRFFEVFEVDVAYDHTLIGSLIITNDGHIHALLYDWDRGDELKTRATKALVQLGAAKFASDIMHNHLHKIVNGVILGVDNEMVGRVGW